MPPGDDATSQWDPVAEFKKAWPSANLPDETILKNLQDPNKFRSAFPQFAHLPDATIQKNMAKYTPAAKAKPIPGMDQPDTGEYQPLGTHERFADQMNDAALGTMMAAPFVDATMPETGVIPSGKQMGNSIRTIGRAVLHPKNTMGDIVEGVANRFAGPPEEVPPEPDYAANQRINRANLMRTSGSSGAAGGPATGAAPSSKPIPGVPKPTPELGSPENPGWVAKLPNKMPPPPEPPAEAPADTIDYEANKRINRANLMRTSGRSGAPSGPASGASPTTSRGIPAPPSKSPEGGFRVGSAGDPTQWPAEDLWARYMKERASPAPDQALMSRLEDELARRGLIKATRPQFR